MGVQLDQVPVPEEGRRAVEEDEKPVSVNPNKEYEPVGSAIGREAAHEIYTPLGLSNNKQVALVVQDSRKEEGPSRPFEGRETPRRVFEPEIVHYTIAGSPDEEIAKADVSEKDRKSDIDPSLVVSESDLQAALSSIAERPVRTVFDRRIDQRERIAATLGRLVALETAKAQSGLDESQEAELAALQGNLAEE